MTEEQRQEGQEALQELFSAAGRPLESIKGALLLQLPGGVQLALRPAPRGGWHSVLETHNGTIVLPRSWGSTAKIALGYLQNTLVCLKQATSVI